MNYFSVNVKNNVTLTQNEKLKKIRELAKKSIEEQESVKREANRNATKHEEKSMPVVNQTQSNNEIGKKESTDQAKANTQNQSNDTNTSKGSPVDSLKAAGYASKLITVVGQGGSNATVTLYEKVDGKWVNKISTKGFVGKLGITYSPSEYKAATPAGIYTLSLGFGIAQNPGMQIPYRRITANDYWVDDSNSQYYNLWMEGPANGRWASAEHLIQESVAYKYGAVIDYNTDRIPGKGSAIFFHVSNGSPTAGCVAIPESQLINILRRIDSNTRMIIVPKEEDLYKY
jgi:L,D-peptidoglycan transpeptidase YkuD (ErfK/YbiS/YcfS/YnhG family)